MKSLGSVFFSTPRLPRKAVPLSVMVMMLGFFGRTSARLQVVEQQKITEPPKTAGEAPGSSSGRDEMIWNRLLFHSCCSSPYQFSQCGEPGPLPHALKTNSAPDICLPRVSVGQLFKVFWNVSGGSIFYSQKEKATCNATVWQAKRLYCY